MTKGRPKGASTGRLLLNQLVHRAQDAHVLPGVETSVNKPLVSGRDGGDGKDVGVSEGRLKQYAYQGSPRRWRCSAESRRATLIGTPARFESHRTDATAHNTNLTPLVIGPAIGLSERNAKIRRGGYRKRWTDRTEG